MKKIAFAAVVLVLGLGAVAHSTIGAGSRTDAAAVVPTALVRSSASFRTDGGLFRMPEERLAPDEGDARLTAPYVSMLPRAELGIFDWAALAHVGVPARGDDLTLVEAVLRIRGAAGAPLDQDDIQRLSAGLSLPDKQPEPGAEVGALATWADAQHLLQLAGGPPPDLSAIRARLAGLRLPDVTPHPYLVMRLADACRELGLAAPPVLAVAEQSLVHLEAKTPDSASNVLDTWAIQREKQRQGIPPVISDAYAEQIRRALAGGSSIEDLPRAALLAILSTSGRGSEATSAMTPLKDRLSPKTGLLRETDPDNSGSVGATYLFARLLGPRFREVCVAETTDALFAAAADTSHPLITRLQAVATLKDAGDKRWTQLGTSLLTNLGAFPASIGPNNLQQYLDVMEPAERIHPDVRRANLAEFDPGADENRQRLAAAALTESYLFANQEDVGRMFPGLQRQLKMWADNPSTPLTRLLIAVPALTSSRLESLGSTYLEALGKKISAGMTCGGGKRMMSADGRPNGPCSLSLTLAAQAVPGAIS